MDEQRERKAGETEATFREVNERIEELDALWLADDEGDAILTIVCECSRPDCVEPIHLRVAELERVRGEADLFVVRPGHEDLRYEKVVASRPDHLIVRKTGEAAVVARERNPRD